MYLRAILVIVCVMLLFLPARRQLARVFAVIVFLSVSLSVRPSQFADLLKRLNVGSRK